jgi:hypothetical protein
MTRLHWPRRALGFGVMLLTITSSVLAMSQMVRAETTPPPSPVSAAGESYLYDPQGRRDPFVSLVGRGIETSAPAGPRGILQHRRGYVAIVQGPDQKTHMLRPNDRLADGTVKAIAPDGIVIVQEVHDPLSLVKHKEIRKGLQGSDEGK